jgi:hypothetical protein
MNVPSPISAGADVLAAPPGVPAQRSSDAFTAYASVHQLGIALQRARTEDGADLRTTA